MKRTLYLHIGSHRTATTSIQQFMHANIDRLMQHGIFYPLGIPRHLRLMNRIFSGEEAAGDVARSLSERADEKNHDLPRIVLSDEDICMRGDLSALVPFREAFDVKIIFSMRRQDEWLESWYFQNIKWQWIPHLSHCTFDEFLDLRDQFHWIRYDRFVAHLEELFGAENLLLSVFEKDQMPDGPVLAFCRQIGLRDLEGFTTPPHANSSMSAEMVEFTRHLPLGAFDPPERNILTQTLAELDRKVLGNTGRQSERLMPPDQREAILADYEPGNRALAERYFDRERLFLAPLPARDAPLADLQIPGDSTELMQRLVGPLLEQLVARGTISAANKNPKPKGK